MLRVYVVRYVSAEGRDVRTCERAVSRGAAVSQVRRSARDWGNHVVRIVSVRLHSGGLA